MQNPVLERQLIDCKELSEVWRKFLDLFNAAIRGGEALNADNEQQFLDCKSRIAMVHDSFMDSLKHDQQIGQNIYGIITRCITMRHVHRMSPAETKKIEIEWHESYLLLNETVTSLEEEIEQLAQINPTAYHLKRFLGNLKGNLKAFFGSRLFKFSTAIIVVVFVLYGIPTFGIYDYDNLRKVNGVSAIYIQWMNVKRLAFPSTPYGDLASFMTKYLPSSEAPNGWAYAKEQKPSKEAMAGYFANLRLSDGKSMKSALDSALAYKGIRINRLSGGRDNIDIGCFYFYANREAQDILVQYNKIPEQYTNRNVTVFAVNNVVVVLEGDDKNLRNGLSVGQFGQKGY